MPISPPAPSLEAWLPASAACTADTPVDTLWLRLQEGLSLLEAPRADAPGQQTDLLSALLVLTLEALLPACANDPETCRSHLATILASLEQQYQAMDADAGRDAGEDEYLLHRLQVRLWFLQMISVTLDGDTPVPYEDLLLYLERIRLQLNKAHDPQTTSLRHNLDRVSLEALITQASSGIEQAQSLADADNGEYAQGQPPGPKLAHTQQRCRRLYTLLLDGITRCNNSLQAPENHRIADGSADTDPTSNDPHNNEQILGTLERAQDMLRRLEQAQHTLIEKTISQVDSLADEDELSAWLNTHSSSIVDFAADTLSDIPGRRLEVQVPVLKATYQRVRRFRSALLEPRSKRLKETYRQVVQAERRLHNEWVEAGVSRELARRFGTRFEARLDVTVLILVLVAIGLLLIDLGSELTPAAVHTIILLDTVICAGLMSDFLLRLHAAPDRRNFFRRHWFTDLLPSIPFAGLGFWFSTIATEAQGVTALRTLRIVAVALRKARPLIQIARVFLFAARGMDRLVRRYRSLLNWDILFFEPHPLNPIESLRVRGERLGRRLRARGNALAEDFSRHQRRRVVARDLALAEHLGQALQRVQLPDLPPPPPPVAHQIAIETVIDRLTHTDPHEIAEILGVDFPRRLAKLEWVAAIPPLRWLPGFSDVLKARRETDNDLDFAEALARRLGGRLQAINDKVLFLSDMHGIITAPQFVDRIGATLINSMRRPRNRLLMLGAGFIVVTLLVEILPFDWLEAAAVWLRKTLGWPILILGVIAFAAVWFGNRLRNLAQTNTDFYTRIAEAKSINLLGDVKRAHAAQDQALLARRVLRPEARIQGLNVAIKDTIPGGIGGVTDHFRKVVLEVFGRDRDGAAGSLAERVYLLYRDYLRGAHFDRSNTHTTDHLLGSPALLNLRHQVLRMRRHELDALEDLDLRRSSGMSGPSVWLRFVTHAMTQRVGQLVEEYNRHAIPLDERQQMFHSQQDLLHCQRWLDHKHGIKQSADDPFHISIDEDPSYATTSFNALDFLSNDPARDSAIENRYGEEILTLVRGDRQRLIREVFGIPAIHLHSPQTRSFNPHALYNRYLSRGRVFMLPFSLLRLLFKALILGIRWFLETLGQLRHPEPVAVAQQQASFSDLRIALRKVHRMRKPVFLATTDLRIRVDVEYLGLHLPGEEQGTLEGSTVFEDLDMIGSSADEQAAYRHIAENRRREMGELRHFLDQHALLGDDLSDRLSTLFPNSAEHRRLEVLRAISAAYAANYKDLKDLIRGRQQLRELVRAANAVQGRQHTPGAAKRNLVRLLKRSENRRKETAFQTWWNKEGQRLLTADADPNSARKSVHRWWRADHQRIASLIELFSGLRQPPEEAAMEILQRVIREVSNWTEQLVTLRTVQSLTILDIQSTTHIVRGLGQYDEDGSGESPEVRVTML